MCLSILMTILRIVIISQDFLEDGSTAMWLRVFYLLIIQIDFFIAVIFVLVGKFSFRTSFSSESVSLQLTLIGAASNTWVIAGLTISFLYMFGTCFCCLI